MSLSNPRQVNPAQKFIEWSGSKGVFYYYDKAEESNVFIEEIFYIVPLDELSTIKGFHDQSNSGVYSNEIKNISKDELVVKSFKSGLIASGLYKDIKGKLEGGKFAKSVYAAKISGDKTNVELELVNISFHGSSLGSFIDAKINVDAGNVVSLAPSKEELTKGKTKYFAPVVKKHEVREDILQKCVQIDKDLQFYLKSYLAKPISENEEMIESNKDVNTTPEQEDDLPF